MRLPVCYLVRIEKMNAIKLISIRETPAYKDIAIQYFQCKWPRELPVHADCINHCIDSPVPLPQWYLLEKEGRIIGGAGLITNDFISRMDLYPWFCALFIEPAHRGNAYAALLMEKAKGDSRKGGFEKMYLCTDHTGYYEKYGFSYIGNGYHPWNEVSRIYAIEL